MKRMTMALLLLGALALVRCENEPGAHEIDRASAALTTTTNVKQALEGAADALALLEDSVLLERLADAFGGGGMVCASVLDEQGVPSDAECHEEPADLELGLSETGDKLATWLEAAVFAEAQVEAEDGSSLTIRLTPDVFCKAPWGDAESSGDVLIPEPAPAVGTGGGASDSPRYGEYEPVDGGFDDGTGFDVDDGCADFLAKVPVRLRFVATSETDVEVDVLFGEARVDPFNLTIGASTLAIDVDLALAKQVWQLISNAYAIDGEVIEVPQVVEGVVRFELSRGVDDGVTFAGLVTSPVTLDKDLNGQHSRFTLGQSGVEASASAGGEQVKLTVALVDLALSVPYQWIVDGWNDRDDEMEGDAPILVSEPPQVTGNLDLTLPALTGTLTFVDADQAVTLVGLGLPGGALRLEREGATLASALLNPDAGGVFDALVDLAGQNARVTVTPLIDLQFGLHLAALTNELDDLPSFVLDETLRLLFHEALAPALEILDNGLDEAVHVTTGTLAFSSTAAPDQAVTVPAGACLTFADDDGDAPDARDRETSEAIPDAEHEILSALVSGSCP